MKTPSLLMSRTLLGVTAIVGVVGLALPAAGSVGASVRSGELSSVAVADLSADSASVSVNGDGDGDGFGWG
ncbi:MULTISPECIES: hypothetical protein [unclassified Streptomyces]|uniref:hypothetical protein n=1 Tax=unclassified Streptomyces TaxID=2593676 RepID=UPI0033A2E259